jgi:RNA polymerase sigma-H factor
VNNSFDLFRNYALCSREYKDFTDKELINFIKMGDFKAEKYLYARYSFVIKKVVSAFFILGGDKDDLFQEAMIGFINAVKSFNFDTTNNFRSFAELCIRRQIISAIRKTRGYEKNLLNSSISIYESCSDNSEDNLIEKLEDINCPNPENVIIEKEQINSLREIRSKILSKFERDVLLEYENGKSYEEISIALDKDVKSIDNALQRIKSKINKNIDKIL